MKKSDHNTKICFSVADEFGVSVEVGTSPENKTAEESQKNKDKLMSATMMLLQTLGFSAGDVTPITPEEYEREYGEDEQDD